MKLKVRRPSAKVVDIVKMTRGKQQPTGDEGDLLQIWLAISTWLRFVAGRPAWLLGVRRDIRRMGLYQFTDRKGRQFNMLLVDSVAKKAEDTNDHAARQFVLDQLKREVTVDTRCSDFALPSAICQWSHPSFGFKDFTRLRDARRDERKEYLHPLREILRESYSYIAGL
jgi:hypothetical protein